MGFQSFMYRICGSVHNYDTENNQASMEIAFHMTKEETVSYTDAKAEVCLRDEGKLLEKVAFPVSGQFTGAFKIAESVILWSCENPKLYQVEIRIFDGQGKPIQTEWPVVFMELMR